MDKLKVFISMPMDGKTKSEIDECTQQAVADIHNFIAMVGYKGKKDYDIEAFSGYVELEENPNIRNSALNYMGASFQKMAEADVVWACVGWTAARGCLFEIKAASNYGIDTMLCFDMRACTFGDSGCYGLLTSKKQPVWVQMVRNFTEDELKKFKQDIQTYQDKIKMIKNEMRESLNIREEISSVMKRDKEELI